MIFFGYDPGGNDKHGVAVLSVEAEKPVSITTSTLSSVEAAIRWFSNSGKPLGIGVDTLTCWSTGPSGWRPADRWLKDQYPEVKGSVASPNSLYGSMSVNGMAVLLALRDVAPEITITETHPKVLHWHMMRRPYSFESSQVTMTEALASEFGLPFSCTSDHEWDAALSALVAFRGVSGKWQRDLHTLPITSGERLVMPCGVTKYFWPG